MRNGVFVIDAGHWELHGPVRTMRSEIAEWNAERAELRVARFYQVVSFDEGCLSNALTNLLQNAIKFTERGEVAVRLRRDARAALCLEVRDTGVGIDANYLPQVFEAFSQENPGLTRKFEGVGLGLSLVRKYLELNGAEIAAASEKGKGSTFTIRFARDEAHEA